MRARPLTMLTAVAAAALVVVAGCEATVHAKAFTSTGQATSQPEPQPQQQLVELLLRAITPTAAPMALPTIGLGGLTGVQARIQEATDQAAASGATLAVAILDRATHQLVSNGNSQIIATASVAKLFIADNLLLQESVGRVTLSAEDHQALDLMLQSSDDGAAEQFWGQDGGDAIITQVASRYGLTSTTPPSDGRWWNTISSAPDLIRYYERLLDGSGGLPLDRARLIVNDLARSTPTGVDGYPQRFGIPDGLYAEPVAVKQGWMCCVGADWMHLSTGIIGADRRYIMVIESLQPSDDATARETITQAVKTIFPNGRI
ncbi:hypothetical protein [Mycobacterium asiaticum]|uniref:hypothetical protein n=1 Tax=Mycobacterium asiaticum TaxID=1790 RepID=UPI0007F04AA2|nr:hypothetical protein [Mycobacterium asiaticum]OBJ58568.1 hypothetical protein A9W94_16205 [Mycobacterium asiaticum]